MIFRRFGYLQTRLLLEKQARLTQFERELDEMDKADFLDNPELLCSIDVPGVDTDTRRTLFDQIGRSFREYGA